VSKRIKTWYEVDPHNRLVLSTAPAGLGAPAFRKILEGRFGIEDNQLVYHVKQPQAGDVPQQIRLGGNWSLEENGSLALTLSKWHRRYESGRLSIKGSIADVKANRLSFVVSTAESGGRRRSYRLSLGGAWRADDKNRLVFRVTRKKASYDELVLQGRWHINNRNQVIYRRVAAKLATKRRKSESLTFKGYWDITAGHRLSYILSRTADSRFDFRAGIGKPVKRGLRYEIGAEYSSTSKTLTLLGKWKVDERFGLVFEMPCGGRSRRIRFGSSFRLDDKNNLQFSLTDGRGGDLGIDAKLSRKILKGDGEIFLRGRLSEGRRQMVAGLAMRF